MKNLTFLVPLMLFSLMACQQAPMEPDLDAEKAAIEELFASFIGSIETQDIETMASMVCNDALVCGTDPSEFWNKDQIIKEWEKMLSADPVNLDFFGDRIIKVGPTGNWAYAIDQFYFSLFTPEIAWRNVYNLEKADGEWKIIMWSSTLVPMNKDLATIAKAVTVDEEQTEE